MSVLHDKDHFVVLLVKVQTKRAFIFDGLRRSLRNFKEHLLTVLKCTKLVSRIAPCQYDITGAGSRIERINLNVDGQEWTLSTSFFTRQADAHNCGPIAAVKIMDLFNYAESCMIDAQLDHGCYRNIVIDKFERLLEKFKDSVCVSVPCMECDLSGDDNLSVQESNSDDGC